MSFEVNMVKTDVNAYKIMNNFFCDALYLFINNVAIYSKNPVSSKSIDVMDIHINSTKIFKGLSEELENIISKNCVLSNIGKSNKIIAISKRGM